MAQPVDSTEIVFLLSDCATKKDNSQFPDPFINIANTTS